MPKKVTTEDIKKTIEKKFPNQFLMDELIYVNARTPIKVKCKLCSESDIVKVHHLLKRADPCKNCNPINAWDLDSMNDWCNEYAEGYRVLKADREKGYLRAVISCPNSNHKNINSPWDHFIRGSRCRECNGKTTHTIENCQKMSDDKDLDYKVLEVWKESYITKVKIKCNNPEHDPFITTWDSFKIGAKCRRCLGITNWNIENLTKLFKEKNINLPDLSLYKNPDTKLKTTTKEGFIIYPTVMGLSSGRQPQIIRKNPDALYNINLWVKLNRPNYKLISTKYSGHSIDELEWEYIGDRELSSGNSVFKVSLDRFMNDNAKHPDLVKSSSKAEIDCEYILKSNSIEYETQKTFEGCVYKNKLRYDFYLPEYNLLIELHGEQHYKPVEFFGGAKGFKERQEKDTIKEAYSKDIGLPLLIIPYWEFDNIERILDSYLNNNNKTFLLK